MGHAAGASDWERWGWALMIAAFVHVGAVLAVLWVPRLSPQTAPPPEDPPLVLLTFMAPPAAAPAPAAPAAVPQRVMTRARARPARLKPPPQVPAPLPEKAPVPEEVEQAPQEEAPALEEPESAAGTGAMGAVVAGLVNSAAKEGVGTGLGVASGGEAVDVKQVSRPPTVLQQVLPQYPRPARSQGIEGLVLVRIIIGIDGRVEPESLRIIRSVPELDAAALAAVRQWRFSPALGRHGRLVRVIVDIPVQFSLK
ncbi:energy transducer TonB [Hyalangium minutum]|uniref:energy transducer TonB n=1 Tax=Hyalangium minutum TaxID=394096 RepID=UPI000A074D8F|nr:energy transducer TonB [Hyalangium minutum]